MAAEARTKQYPLTGLYFYLTQSCNLSCRHCYINPAPHKDVAGSGFLALELFEKALDQAAPLGLQGVKLTGGEPLLHPGISDLIEVVHRRRLNLTVETNGCLATPKLAHRIAECADPYVSVSLDSPDAATHEWLRGVKGCFEEAVDGLRCFVEAGIAPQLIMSLVKRNATHIDRMVAFAEELGCESVKFNIVQPTERGGTMYRRGECLTTGENIELGGYITGELQARSKIRLSCSLPPAFLPLSYMFDGYRHGCGSGCNIKNILGILWNGDVSICGIGTCVSEMRLGSVASDRLADIWENNAVITAIRSGLPRHIEGVCRQCLFRDSCYGGCPAHNYYAARSLFSPGWFCQQAYLKNIFPQGRIQQA